MDFSFDFNVDVALQNLFQLGIAYVMALPIALNREQRSRPRRRP